MSLAKVILRKGRESSLLRRHPWVFSGAIESSAGAKWGDVVEISSHSGEFLGIGHFADSSIAVKVLTFERQEVNEAFYVNRIRCANSLRLALGLPKSEVTTAYRLVNAEGDLLPGLIIDLFNGCAVVEFHSLGMFYNREIISAALLKVLGKSVSDIRYSISANLVEMLPKEISIATKGVLYGGADLTDENVIFENGAKFWIQPGDSQKTGFYTDQRDNRALFKSLSKGRTVLDCFSFTGGFAINALQGGATSATLVDSSDDALKLATRNLEENAAGGKFEVIKADGLQYLREIGDQFDCIVLDPPKFVKHSSALKNGLKGYESINYNAIKQVRADGLIFTFSCSQLVSPQDFRGVVFRAAKGSGREVSVVHELRQAACHPVSIYHPEGEYLKGLVLWVR